MASWSTPIVVDGKVVGIACHRGRRPSCKCGRVETRQCDFPLKGRKAGKTCDASLCDRCTTKMGPELDYCPAHAALAKSATQTGLDPSLFREGV